MAVGDGWELAPGDAPWSDFHWWKVPTKGILVLVLLGKEPVYYVGHYVDGRMWPCLKETCGMCKQGIGSQVRYVMAAAEIATKRVGILEVGRGNGLIIRDWAIGHEGLTGVVIELEKHSHARTSRTEIRCIEKECGPWPYHIELPDLRRALLLTWTKANMPIPPGLQTG
jgi:hypothetical protein